VLVAAGQTIIVSPSASNNCGISRLPAGFIHHAPPPQWRPFPAHPVACAMLCASPRGAPSPSSTYYNREKKAAWRCHWSNSQRRLKYHLKKQNLNASLLALPSGGSKLLLLREMEGNILSCPNLPVCCHWLRIEILSPFKKESRYEMRACQTFSTLIRVIENTCNIYISK